MSHPLVAAVVGETVLLPNPAGLHARPAAALAQLAKRFSAEVELVRQGDKANARSVVAIMGLGTTRGDAVQVRARGADAAQAVAALTEYLRAGCGEAPDAATAAAPSAAHTVSAANAPVAAVATSAPDGATARTTIPEAAAPGVLHGVCASAGLAVGRVLQWQAPQWTLPQRGGSPALERLRLQAALTEADAQLQNLAEHGGAARHAAILQAQRELLADPEVLQQAHRGIGAGESAPWAWNTAVQAAAERMAALAGEHHALLRERAVDLRDVGRRVLAQLVDATPTAPAVPPHSIVVADELAPSDYAALDRAHLAGICTVRGGASGHLAILARNDGIAALCGVAPQALELANGTEVVLDASQGLLHTRPTPVALDQARAQIERSAARRAREQAVAQALAHSRDGQRIEVVANVASADEARSAVLRGAEGVGLLRTEWLFADRSQAPTEDEQFQAYAAIAAALGPAQPLVVRTLDAGGDKPLAYLGLPPEDNPFLGLRGIRISLAQPELLRTQLRALLRAARTARIHILLPMVATLEEVRAVRAVLAQEQAALGVAPVPLGAMVEVPSAALLADALAREVDFFSVGSNDLTQYTLAMDRGDARLAGQADGLHPAVLQLMARTCQAAQQHGRWVGVCGGLASEPLAVPVLLGLGVTELSTSIAAIAATKALVARLDLRDCRVLAQDLLRLDTAQAVRDHLRTWIQPFDRELEETA